MTRDVQFTGVFLHSKVVPCAHSCKYCLMGDKKLARLPVRRITALFERFLEWEKATAGSLPVAYIINYTSDYDRETLELVHDLSLRFPRKYQPLSGITLGGLPARSRDAFRDWLLERQRFGCRTVHASLAGSGSVHDYWNGKPGNFDSIMSEMEVAGEIGMALGARLMISKSTLPSSEKANERLATLPKHPKDWRYATTFFYAGWGTRLEAERIDEEIRDQFPTWLQSLIARPSGEGIWRSEREWLSHIGASEPKPTKTNLVININDGNVDALEAMTCDEIVADYSQRTRRAYAAFPDLPELADRYGDKTNRHIYELERCIEMKWLDAFLRDNPVSFERQLTHLQLGN